MGMGRSCVRGVLLPDPSQQDRPGTHRMGQGFPNEKGTGGDRISWERVPALQAARLRLPPPLPHAQGSASRPGSSSPGNPASPRWHVSQTSPRTGFSPRALGCCWKGCHPPRHGVQHQATPATPAQRRVPSECLGPCGPPGDIGVRGTCLASVHLQCPYTGTSEGVHSPGPLRGRSSGSSRVTQPPQEQPFPGPPQGSHPARQLPGGRAESAEQTSES